MNKKRIVVLLISFLILFSNSVLAKEYIESINDLPLLENTNRQTRAFSLLRRDSNVSEDNIVILYKTEEENNIKELQLEVEDFQAGISLNGQVDVLQTAEDVDVDQTIKEISKKSNVLAVAKDQQIRISGLPNDTYINNQYYYTKIGADKTWNRGAGTPVKIAVLDSGIDALHPDLEGRIELSGYDYLNKTTSIIDHNGHGTAVAGIIAANTNNGMGIAGIAGNASVTVVPYSIIDSQGNGQMSDLIAALTEITKRDDIDIINMSLGSDDKNPVEEAACNLAYNSGKILIAATGNENKNTVCYPAAWSSVIAVGSVNSSDQRCSSSDWGAGGGSNYGSATEFVAPGDNIVSTVPTSLSSNRYYQLDGTSFSAPMVAATCALVLNADPSLTPAQVRNILRDTAQDIGTKGKDIETGYGIVRVDKALEQVTTDTPTSVKVTGVSVSPTAQTLSIGEQMTLRATVSPATATNRQVSWQSSDSSIVSVSSNGTIIAKKAGTAVITVTTVDQNKTASATITVVPSTIAVTSIKLNTTSTSLQVGNSVTLKVAISPSNASNKAVSWTSSDPTVASVSSSGVVTGKKAGKAVITVTTSNNKSATCTVTVTEQEVTSSLSVDQKKFNLILGDSAVVLPGESLKNVAAGDLVWVSSNPKVVSVDSSGRVTAKKVGSTTIQVAPKNDQSKAISCRVVVKSGIQVNSIKLTKSSVELSPGKTVTLKALVQPTKATNKDVVWTSSDPAVATVDSTGKVTAVSSGSCTISATSVNGQKAAKSTITVK